MIYELYLNEATFFFKTRFHVPQAGPEFACIVKDDLKCLIHLPLPPKC